SSLAWQNLSQALIQILAAFAFSIALRADGTYPVILIRDSPEKAFFSKVLDYHGIPIKAHFSVSNEALYAAYGRLSILLSNQPVALSNLVAAGAELHIIARDQVTTDLPEWAHDKGKARKESN